MYHQGRHSQLVEQLDAARLGQYRHDLALGPVRVERPVVGLRRLLQQHFAVVSYLRAAQGRQQVGLLLDSHFTVRRAAPGQQLHQRRGRRRQPRRP
ncbi:hypothetical protein D9M71_195500 [compost metagenome]